MKRISRWIIAVCLLAALLFTLGSEVFAQQTPEAETQPLTQQMWGGRRKTTPTPKPDKTPVFIQLAHGCVIAD